MAGMQGSFFQLFSCSDDQQFATFAILAPMIGKRKKSQNEDAYAAPNDDSASDQKVVFGFRTVFVFDISQTEGKELPEFATLNGDPGAVGIRLSG
jgi:hypothetical protein